MCNYWSPAASSHFHALFVRQVVYSALEDWSVVHGGRLCANEFRFFRCSVFGSCPLLLRRFRLFRWLVAGNALRLVCSEHLRHLKQVIPIPLPVANLCATDCNQASRAHTRAFVRPQYFQGALVILMDKQTLTLQELKQSAPDLTAAQVCTCVWLFRFLFGLLAGSRSIRFTARHQATFARVVPVEPAAAHVDSRPCLARTRAIAGARGRNFPFVFCPFVSISSASLLISPHTCRRKHA